jgi:diguanylate cyclase (GGDEF)-like protein/PAS domain S-box-containing protein
MKINSDIKPTLNIYLVFLMGLFLSGISAWTLFKTDEKAIINEFKIQVDEQAASFYREVTINIETLYTLSVLFSHENLPSLSLFSSEAKKILERHPYIQALEWVPRVLQSDRHLYEAENRIHFPDFHFTEQDAQGRMVPAKERKEYFPVYYVEPVIGNEAAIGFDISSNHIRRKTLNKSRSEARSLATSSIKLVQEVESQKGFLVFLPIYKESSADNDENFRGFVLGVFRIGDIFNNSILGEWPIGIHMTLIDETSDIKQDILYVHNSQSGIVNEKPFSFKKELPDILGRKWSIMAFPTSNYLSGKRSWLPIVVFFVGMILTIILILYIRHISRSSEERKQASIKLTKSEARLKEAQNIAKLGNWELDLITNTLHWSDEVYKIFGLDPNKIKPSYEAFINMVHPDDRATVDKTYTDSIKTKEPYEMVHRLQLNEGGIRYVSENCVTYYDDAENAVRSVGIVQDITDRKLSEEALNDSEKKFYGLLENDPDGMLIVNEKGTIEIVNKQLEMLTGYTPEELIGEKVEVLIPERFKDHELHRNEYMADPHLRYMGEGIELFVQRRDGSEFPAEISLCPLDTKKGLNVSVSIRDVSERKKIDELVSYQANHDALTGLVNRQEFERRTERLLSTVKQDKGVHALCYLDLDQFKVVNDTFGHTAGDEMLRQVSSLLSKTIRHRDTLARLGGDEFGVLMEHCPFDDAHKVTTSILTAINDFQFEWEGQLFRVSVSIGLVAISEKTASLTKLLRDAETACYVAKDKGRNCIHVSQVEDVETAQRHGEMQWVAHINQALEEDRFCLYAQAIEPLDGSTGKHYELLIRMVDCKGKIIPPGSFLPAAERYNLIEQLDRWVIKKAFNYLAENSEFLQQDDFISINLSGLSLARNDFLGFIINQFEKTGINSEKVCLEITETAAISNLGTAMKFISTLKVFGCSFALDDFGSGLSSFGYLKNLPVDYLKIDGMFVKDIVDDPIDFAMVESINTIGQVMGMKTIAEFVENDDIKSMLKDIGVNYAQGYGIDKPKPFEDILGRQNIGVGINKDAG